MSNFSTTSAQRLSLELQRARTELAKSDERIVQLLSELEQQVAENVRLQQTSHHESNSRLLAEVELDQTRDRLQLAATAAGLALWDWKIQSPDVFLTARWGEMLGGVALEGSWPLVHLLERVHPEDRHKVDDAWLNLMSTTVEQATQMVQFRMRVNDAWIWLQSHGMVTQRNAQGSAVRVMGTHADITERKRKEIEASRSRMETEHALKHKSELLANLSHEIRTPLSTMMCLTHLLMDSPLTAEQARWAQMMDQSSQAMLTLLNDILDVDRIESGKLPVELVAFDLHDVLKEIHEIFTEKAKSKGLLWSLVQSHQVPRLFHGDPGRLRQVLLNLLSNAVRFTPAGGAFGLSVAMLSDDDSAAHARMEFVVHDTGIGIDPVTQANMFDEYAQADTSPSRQDAGRGLGLAIAAKLVRLMGARLTLISALGQGSKLSFSLSDHQVDLPPTNVAAEASSPLPPIPSSAQKTGRFAGLQVLAVDDHAINELLIETWLSRVGCRVLLARSGREALDIWKRSKVRLVLMDLQMPGMDGLEATRLMREFEIKQKRPRTWIAAVTANVSRSARERCLAAGMDGYLSKPIQLAELLRALEAGCAALTLDGSTEARQETSALAGLGKPSSKPARHGVEPISSAGIFPNDESGGLQKLSVLSKALLERDSKLALEQTRLLLAESHEALSERASKLIRGLDLAVNAGEWELGGKLTHMLRVEIAQSEITL